jgi:Ca2+/H+ antiporter, TMEM165/GDT1 family
MGLIPLFASFFIIAIAELGDKTLFLVITLAAKYPMDKVIYGITSAIAFMMFLVVILGTAVHRLIPQIFISILAGAFFIIYGLMIIKPIEGKKDETEDKTVEAKDPFWVIFGSFFLAEFGDMTQLATFALAARYSAPVLVWIGATLGMLTVDLFGLAIGNILKNYLPERALNYLSGVIFIVFGAVIFVGLLMKI